MKTVAFLLLYFVSRVSPLPAQDPCPSSWDGSRDLRCLSDGTGHALMTCTLLSKVTAEEVWTDKAIWVPSEVTVCKKPFDKCKCYDHYYATWSDPYCECVRGTKVPNFPATGVIYWNGTRTHMDEYWSSDPATITIMTGEVHKNSNGRYLYKQWQQKVGEKKRSMEFKIIIRDGTSFTMYSGSDESKTCIKQSVDTEESLSSIWKNPYRYIMRDVVEQKKPIHKQIWKYNNDGEDSNERWMWIVEYNSEIDQGIPVKYTYDYRDEIEGQDTEDRLDYHYQPVAEGDESFELHQYCSNI